ncbi:OmpA family protein [Vibrio natriegens]|uniref:OmpA family protein n=1 Tax=Vibrio natriegens TaxID=691 RepID=UPI003556FC02
MNIKKLIILMSLFASQAMAAEGDFLSDNVYFGVKGGYQVLDDDYSHASNPDGAHLGVFGGVRLNDKISWDIGYQSWEQIESANHKIDIDMIESALRYDAYINENVSLFGRAGIGFSFVEDSSTQGKKYYDGVSPLAEVGINYWLTDKVSTGLSYQYTRAVGGHDDLDIDSNSINLSLTYNFTNRFKYETVEVVKQEPAPVAVPVTVIELQDSTLFGFDSFELTSEGKEELLSLISRIPQESDALFSIIGHTDTSGPAEYNMKLSKRRAQAVKNFLVEIGLSESSIIVEGKGETQPIASNETREGRIENRRVEVKVDYHSEQ